MYYWTSLNWTNNKYMDIYVPQVGFGDSPHHCLDMLGLAHPQTQVNSQRLSAQTIQRHRLSNGLDDRPQVVDSHNDTEDWFDVKRVKMCRNVNPKRHKTGRVEAFKQWRRLGCVPIHLPSLHYALSLPVEMFMRLNIKWILDIFWMLSIEVISSKYSIRVYN